MRCRASYLVLTLTVSIGLAFAACSKNGEDTLTGPSTVDTASSSSSSSGGNGTNTVTTPTTTGVDIQLGRSDFRFYDCNAGQRIYPTTPNIKFDGTVITGTKPYGFSIMTYWSPQAGCDSLVGVKIAGLHVSPESFLAHVVAKFAGWFSPAEALEDVVKNHADISFGQACGRFQVDLSPADGGIGVVLNTNTMRPNRSTRWPRLSPSSIWTCLTYMGKPGMSPSWA